MKFKKFFFNLKYKILFKSSLKYYNQLELNSTLSQSELSELNWRKRKDIVQFAFNNIPFYQKWYKDNQFDPSMLNEPKDWVRVPILTKELIRENFESIANPNLSSKIFKKSTTGGSTGNPLTILFDKRVPLETIGWRVLTWWGIRPEDNQAYVFRNIHKGFKLFLNSLIWWPTKRIFLDASAINEKDIIKFLAKYNRIRPVFLQGYVGAIYELAMYIRTNDIKVNAPNAVWVTSAPLTENQRTYIESAFNAPVYDQYGCGEIFWLAAECRMKKGLHFMSDIRHIEFVSSEDNDEYGDTIISDLENRAFPIIRYKNGDRGRFLNFNCGCGCNLPLIDKVKGRVTDFIRTPSNTYIDGAYLTTLFDDEPDLVSGFQVIQNEDFSIDVNCVVNPGFNISDPYFEELRQVLNKKVNQELEININSVSSLIQDRGKLKFIINRRNDNRN